MSDAHLTITAEEKDFLLRLHETALKSELVEEHRTDRLAYRKLVQSEISLTESLLAKLRQ